MYWCIPTVGYRDALGASNHTEQLILNHLHGGLSTGECQREARYGAPVPSNGASPRGALQGSASVVTALGRMGSARAERGGALCRERTAWKVTAV